MCGNPKHEISNKHKIPKEDKFKRTFEFQICLEISDLEFLFYFYSFNPSEKNCTFFSLP
jgi:hypothetical protein